MNKKSKKLLAVVAHPDDESFGFGGTLAKYAKEGVDIHVLCATKGEHGEGGGNLGLIREKEIRTASKILGVKRVDFLGYIDGTLCNNLYHEIAQKVERKIAEFKPQVILTFDRLGISGHIDHVAMSLITTYVCQKYQDQLSLYYYCVCKEYTDKNSDYFIYFPPGYEFKDIDVIIDTKAVWELKVAAMEAHKSQINDVKRILTQNEGMPKQEYFIKACIPKKHTKPATDLFTA